MKPIFYVEYIISPYDGSAGQGIFSTLQKAVDYCQEMIENDSASHTEDPFEKEGYVIYEYILDDTTRACKSYNDQGTLMTKYNLPELK